MNGFTLTRSIAAAPERVWSAFTNADEYAAWIWPPAWNTECAIDLRIGGVFHVAAAEQSLSVNGTYVDEESRKNHEQGWSDCLDRLPAYLEAR